MIFTGYFGIGSCKERISLSFDGYLAGLLSLDLSGFLRMLVVSFRVFLRTAAKYYYHNRQQCFLESGSMLVFPVLAFFWPSMGIWIGFFFGPGF